MSQDQTKSDTGSNDPANQSAGEVQSTDTSTTGTTSVVNNTPVTIPGVDASAPSVTAKLSFGELSGTRASELSKAKDEPAKVAAPVTGNVLKIEQQLVNYMHAMAPSVVQDPVVGGQWQKSLFVLLRTILSNEDQTVFRREWSTVLNVFNQNKEGVFHENYVFRFPQHWGISDTEATLFRRLITVIIQTALPDNRANFGSNVRLDTVAEGLNEVGKNNLVNFYA